MKTNLVESTKIQDAKVLLSEALTSLCSDVNAVKDLDLEHLSYVLLRAYYNLSSLKIEL